MRHAYPLILLAITSAAFACSAPQDLEEVGEVADELVQFPAAAFAGAPSLSYGNTSAAIATSRTVWGVVKFNGAQNDEIVATVAPQAPDRLARAYLVEKRPDGKYVAILSGTSSVDGLVRATLASTQTYYIVFRDYSRRNASFTVKLETAGGLPAACSGPALLNQGLVDRTPQAQNPGISVTGQFKSTIRRCNVATGCGDPVVQNNANSAASFARASDGKWSVNGAFTATHDGATGDLAGSASIRADDGRNISVALTGAATTACVSVSGRNRTNIDAITYYDVEVTYQATTPPIAARTPIPATPPAAECDGQAAITDEEVLARFPRGTAQLTLGQASINEDRLYCHAETGCQAWSRGPTGYTLQAWANVLGASSLGVSFYNHGASHGPWALEDGTVAINGDVLRRSVPNTTYTSSISDTHLLVKETNVYTQGDYKYRRYVCIPIPPHP
jgi:hypothetical protein